MTGRGFSPGTPVSSKRRGYPDKTEITKEIRKLFWLSTHFKNLKGNKVQNTMHIINKIT
jgi:hypothetical protein